MSILDTDPPLTNPRLEAQAARAREARAAIREEKLRQIYEEAIVNIEPLDFLASITGLRGSAKGGLIIGLEIDPANFEESVALSKFTPIKGLFHVEPAPYGV